MSELLDEAEAFIAFRAAHRAQHATSDRALLERDIADLTAQLERWRAAYGAGLIDIPGLERYTKRISAQLADARESLAAHTAADQREDAVRKRIHELAPLVGDIRRLGLAAQRDIVKSLVERIILARGKETEIIWL